MRETDCTFCDEIKNPYACEFRSYISSEELDSRVIASSDNFLALAGLGAIRAGYILMLPKPHFLSFAYLDPAMMKEAQKFKEEIRQIICKKYGEPIIFEHGDVDKQLEKPGNCIDHAHLHFYPSENDLFLQLSNKFKFSRVKKLMDLRLMQTLNQPYIYYEKGEKGFSFLINKNLPSQYMRRLFMEAEGRPDEWDWSVFVGKEYILRTVNELRENN